MLTHFRLFGIVALLGVLPQCRAASEPHCANGACDGAGFEYIVVGSGAGGGPLAARLARAGKRVLLVEAGQDVGDKPKYQVPAMHALSTEDPDMAWWFWVHHSKEPAVDQSDTKWTPQGILYPRGSALGGSTAVNAMVTVLPSRSDWNRIAELTGDSSWRADSMDKYYDRVREWLGVDIPDPNLAITDRKVSSFLTAAAIETAGGTGDAASTAASLGTLLSKDVNEELRSGETTGIYRLPLATSGGHRNGTRERIVDTANGGFPLTVITGAFVTRVLWDEHASTPTAVGVEYVQQGSVYGASLAPQAPSVAPSRVLASQEVILAAGTFNTPQILMLSGVGEDAQLAAKGIESRLARAGVGENLQDRYEAPVVSEFTTPFDVVAKCRLDQNAPDDPCLDQWTNDEGVYTTPGFLASVLMRSSPEVALADLQVFAVPTDARGYYPGYSKDSALAKNRFSWLLLKAHTQNHDGTVRLADASPFSRPEIAFNSYDEANPLADPDLLALVKGVDFVRRVEKQMSDLVTDDPGKEIFPGADVATDADLAAWIRHESWGHHACCTDKMGRVDDPAAVVDSNFRVIGANGLRVVDASTFPEIPGTFIALPTYMIAEKAADAILGAAK